MPMYLKNAVFSLILFFELFLFCSNANAQLHGTGNGGPIASRLRQLYHDKTQGINELEKKEYTDTVIMVPAFSDYKLYLRGSIYDIYDDSNPAFYSGLLKPLSDTDYIVNLTNAEVIRQKITQAITSKINKNTTIQIVLPRINDIGIIEREISKIKKLFKDSLRQNYTISDSLTFALSAYKNKQVIITDLEFKHYNYGIFKEFIAFYRFYVIDVKLKKIVFYNYVLDIGVTYYREFYNFYTPKKTNQLIKSYKQFLRKNSKK